MSKCRKHPAASNENQDFIRAERPSGNALSESTLSLNGLNSCRSESFPSYNYLGVLVQVGEASFRMIFAELDMFASIFRLLWSD